MRAHVLRASLWRELTVSRSPPTTDTSSIVIASGEDFVYRNQSIISHHFEAQLSGRPLPKYEAKAIIGPAVTSPD
jgi:hypothetical protein